MNIQIPIVTHSNYDLSKFDFSWKDIYILDIRNEEFREYINSFEPDSNLHQHNFSNVEQILTDRDYKHLTFYAIIKKNYKKDYNYNELYNVFKILLIIFPTDLQILHRLTYHEMDGATFAAGVSSWHEVTTGEYPGNYLTSHDDYLTDINEFIKLVFDRLKQDNYIGLAISHYLTSFKSSHLHYQFLGLCMVLEASISGTSELTYRLKRNTAVLVGQTQESSKNIFNNLDEIYKLRSTIIHGDNYDREKLKKYLPFILAIASRTIIELLLHNFTMNKNLNQKITELGFGQKHNISEGYKSFELNLLTYFKTNYDDCKKN